MLNNCPHCGAEERHHRVVERVDSIQQTCPICGNRSKLWFDARGTITYMACGHVHRIVSIDGVTQIEFLTK